MARFERARNNSSNLRSGASKITKVTHYYSNVIIYYKALNNIINTFLGHCCVIIKIIALKFPRNVFIQGNIYGMSLLEIISKSDNFKNLRKPKAP